MKPAPLALLVLAVVVVTAWPLTSPIGAATATAAVLRSDVQPACAPEGPGEPGEALVLPPGHPPIPSLRLPPGHPPITSGEPSQDPRLPPGHPPIPSGHDPIPSGPGPIFQEPVLLTI